jgi:hypothetical protein
MLHIEGGVPVHDVKACRGSEGVAPLIPNHSTGWTGVVNFTLRYLYGRERTPVLFV